MPRAQVIQRPANQEKARKTVWAAFWQCRRKSLWAAAFSIARLFFRGPLAGIVPILANKIAKDNNLASSRSRAAIALVAIDTADRMLLGGYQPYFYRRGSNTKGAINDNITDSINKTMGWIGDLSNLGLSTYSYWRYVAGNGSAAVVAAAVLVSVGITICLGTTVWVGKKINESVERQIPVDRCLFNSLYVMAGLVSSVGLITGLILASKDQESNLQWQGSTFFPVLWATMAALAAQGGFFRNIKAAQESFGLVTADNHQRANRNGLQQRPVRLQATMRRH
ncbi:hypothetical protein HJFPF1_02599 [Paramyrothecium foliicola]|nr:hypothetical protein HJFPF1_02599 [Paramyrothecium foliicola]